MEQDKYNALALLESIEETLIKEKARAEIEAELCEVILGAIKKAAAENIIKNSGKPQNIERR